VLELYSFRCSHLHTFLPEIFKNVLQYFLSACSFFSSLLGNNVLGHVEVVITKSSVLLKA